MRINPHALKQWRTERGMTRVALAAAAKCPQPHLTRLELGQREPSWALLSRLATALGVDPRALIGPDEPIDAASELTWPHARGRRKAVA